MPYDLRIIPSRDFIRMDAEGHFDFPQSRQVFRDVMWACAHSKIGRVMLDVRDAKGDVTAAQICALASVCDEVTPDNEQHKVALLCLPYMQFDRAVGLAAAGRDRGWNIMAFYEFEQAFGWLIT
jgi:hypothetical protein